MLDGYKSKSGLVVGKNKWCRTCPTPIISEVFGSVAEGGEFFHFFDAFFDGHFVFGFAFGGLFDDFVLFGFLDFAGAVLAVVFESFLCFGEEVAAGGEVALHAGEFFLLLFGPVGGTAGVHEFDFHFGQVAFGALIEPVGAGDLFDQVMLSGFTGLVGGHPDGFEDLEVDDAFVTDD